MLEEALEHNIRRFLLELGTGFAYVGSQMELRMPGGTSYFPDMVFYHTKLKCYVVLELKSWNLSLNLPVNSTSMCRRQTIF